MNETADPQAAQLLTEPPVVPTPTLVHIRVASDADAKRITAVLEALVYTVVREFEETVDQRLWMVDRLIKKHKLTEREQQILRGILKGLTQQMIGEQLGISHATVKWHMHNILAKTHTRNREDLLRLALLGHK